MHLRRSPLFLAGLLAILPMTAQAQDIDFDGLAACAMVYDEIGRRYADMGDAEASASFADTALAYSSAGYTLLDGGQHSEDAYLYAQNRMELVAESLNEASRQNKNGDLGLIEEWLPWCDNIGPTVSQILQQAGTGQ